MQRKERKEKKRKVKKRKRKEKKRKRKEKKRRSKNEEGRRKKERREEKKKECSTDGDRLQIFDSQDKFVRMVGDGQVKQPNHPFVDSDDNILVADWGNNCIQVFHQNGSLIKTIGTGQLVERGVCMDREGRIFVSEGNGANRISIF